MIYKPLLKQGLMGIHFAGTWTTLMVTLWQHLHQMVVGYSN